MPWFKVDDGFHSHPKVIDLPIEAVGLWTLAGAWCAQYLTDGHISAGQIRRLGGSEEVAEALVDAALWTSEGNGYQFKDWDDYQPMKEDVEAEREAARQRMRDVRAKRTRTSGARSEDVRANNPRTFGGTTPERSGEVRQPRPSPSRPDPTSSASAEDKLPPKSRKKPETTIPDDWTPTEAHAAKAKEKGVDLHTEAENFKLHAEANDRRLVNWNAGFSMWLTKSRPSGGPGGRPSGPPYPPRQSGADAALQRGQERHEQLADYQPVSWADVFTPKQIGDGT